MVYCVDLKDSNFKFKKRNSTDILKELKDLITKEKLAWISKSGILQAETIEDCFEELRYPLTKSKEYYRIDYFSGEKLGDEEKIFNSIAKYIEKDSYLEFVGEDGDIFRLVFDGEKCQYKYPKISWE